MDTFVRVLDNPSPTQDYSNQSKAEQRYYYMICTAAFDIFLNMFSPRQLAINNKSYTYRLRVISSLDYLTINQAQFITQGTNWVNKQHHSKVLFNSFSMNGHTLGFRP